LFSAIILSGSVKLMHEKTLNIQRLPLLWPVAAWTAGLALARTDALGITTAICVFFIAFVLLMLRRQRAVALMLALGALWGTVDLLLDARQMRVDEHWLGQNIKVEAQIERAEHSPAYTRLLLSHIVDGNGRKLPGMALLYLHGSRQSQQVKLMAGQSIRVVVKWHRPRNHLNPGAFDYKAWCFDRHIALIGSVKGSLEITDLSTTWLESARQHIRNAIGSVPGSEAAVLDAVLLGERNRIGEETNAAFSATGTAHLLAISGMHVGMAAAWAFALLWWLLTRFEGWIVRLPVRALALAGGFAAAFTYATLAGWPLPAVRSALMLAAAVLAWWLASRAQPVNTLLAALVLILFIDPSAIASLSLWLSFAATSAILLWSGNSNISETQASGLRLASALKALVWVSVLATLATLPMIISTFGRVPVYSLPANLILVPVYGFLVMPLALLAEVVALCGLNTAAEMLMQGSGFAIRLGLNILTWFTELPAGQIWAVKPPVWQGLLYMVGMFWVGWQLWLGKRLRVRCGLSLVLAAYLFLVIGERNIITPNWVIWDVGQGAASTLLLPGNQVIIVDAPGRWGSRFNGGTTVASGLRSMGITHADVLVLSHAQSDHLGGALSLLQHLNKTGQIWLPDVPSAHADIRVKSILAHAESNSIPVHWLAQGDRHLLATETGQVELTVLWPPRFYAPSNDNNASLVLAVSLPDQYRLLWPGDIEAVVEKQLLKKDVGTVDAMLIPHHGSLTSSQSAFLRSLMPALAVAQAGFANHYGFPRAEIVKRYEAIGANVRNTANGAVMVRWLQRGRPPEISQWQEETGSRRVIATGLNSP
jgi:competence protein ComEC